MDPPEAKGTPGERQPVVWKRWKEVDALFDRALDLPEPKQVTFVVEACGDDFELRDAVLGLLSASLGRVDRLSRPDEPLVRAALHRRGADVPGAPEIGEHLGHYRLVGELGRGGMATVFEAERADGSFTRRVAVKILRVGGLATEDLVRRAIAERQILSGLQHPNIATLLDGGTTDDGKPYLVMELVEGEPITRWVRRRNLTVDERLRLFLQVVDAVSYAHGQLVVHRDLKPTNVLVTADGQAKLLDFGVAKLLDAGGHAEEPLTRVGAAPMTPEFASPEQLRGERVTAVSDVFQLGVLLYRILTGSSPYDGDTTRHRLLGVDVQVVRPSDAVTDRSLCRVLRGDLDTIVLQALQPDPVDRYGSAEALAADLRRQLEGRPIAARPASPWVRVRKFSRRNPWFWPVAATLALGVGAYLSTVVGYSRQLEQERNEAVAQAQRAQALRSFMVNQFGLADPYSDEPVDPDVTVVEAMSLGAETARRELADQPLLQAEMLSAIAQVFENLSLPEEARGLLDEAMAIRRAQSASESPEQLEDLGRLGATLGLLGQRDSARDLLRRSLDLERSTFGPDHPRTAEALERLSFHWFREGEYAQAAAWAEEAVEIRRGVVPLDAAALGSALGQLADSYRWIDRWEDARAAAEEALETARASFGEEHPVTAANKGDLAQVLAPMGEHDEAVRLYQEALPVLERTLGEQHVTTMANWNNLGIVLDQSGDLEGAEQVHRRILQLRLDRYADPEHPEIGNSHQNLAALLVRQERYAEADSMARLSERIFRAARGDEHYSVAFSLITQSQAAMGRDLFHQAEQQLRQAIQILEPLFGSAYPTSAAQCRLGRALALQGRDAEGEPLMESALASLRSGDGVPASEIERCQESLTGV